MMKSEDAANLANVCCTVFEELAFMFGEVAEEELVSPSQCFMRANISFKGNKTGTIEIIVPSDMSNELAHNILGIDEDEELPSGSAADALKEFVNTVCGQMLTSNFGEEAVFDLSIPEVSEINNADWQSLINSREYVNLVVEDSPVLAKTSF